MKRKMVHFLRRCLSVQFRLKMPRPKRSGKTDLDREFYSLAVCIMKEEANRFVRNGGMSTV